MRGRRKGAEGCLGRRCAGVTGRAGLGRGGVVEAGKGAGKGARTVLCPNHYLVMGEGVRGDFTFLKPVPFGVPGKTNP